MIFSNGDTKWIFISIEVVIVLGNWLRQILDDFFLFKYQSIEALLSG